MSPLVKTASTPTGGGTRAGSSESRRESPAAAGSLRPKKGYVPGARKIVDRELPAFSRQLAAMLSAGMPIVTSLDTLAEQANSPNMRGLILALKESIEAGRSLSEAVARFPSVFNDLYVNMVRGGEASGMLPETISRLASLLEDSAKLRRKVKSAMTYPIIVLSIALIITVGLITFIVPVFAGMYKEFGSELPGPTQFLVDLSQSFRRWGPYALVFLILGIFLFKRWKATPAGGYAVDRILIHMPLFGPLILKVAVARFARVFSQLIKSGVPIMEALQIVAGAGGNKVIEKAILTGRNFVERGETLSAGLAEEPLLPKMLVRMLAAGEKTGKMDEMMESLAGFYEDEVNAAIAGLTSMIEPLLMVFLGVVVGGIMVCMFLPIFRMAEAIKM